MSWAVSCPLWFPVLWSREHPRDQPPYELWLAWHYANGWRFGRTDDLPAQEAA